jgi:hypothetical protein
METTRLSLCVEWPNKSSNMHNLQVRKNGRLVLLKPFIGQDIWSNSCVPNLVIKKITDNKPT